MKIVNVVAAVIKDGNKIYVAQRGYGSFKGGWEFPGGKIEPGETDGEALKREIREELEMEIDIVKYIGTVDYDYPNFHINMRCYLCEISSGTPVLTVHEDAKWVNIDDINEIDLLPADKLIVKSM